jgi:two-component system CheB/CheR fusion protein
VVSDVGISGMDTALRQRPAYAGTPAIALTGFGSSRGVENALAAGFTAHIGKPVSLEGLMKVIRTLPLPMATNPG